MEMTPEDKFQKIDDETLYTDCVSLPNYNNHLADFLMARGRHGRPINFGVEDINKFNQETIEGWVYCNDFLEKRRRASNFLSGAIDVVFSYEFYKTNFRQNLVQEFLRKLLVIKETPDLVGDPSQTILVMFYKETPAFVGADMNTYGPFNKGDSAQLPVPNAVLLVERGLARSLSPARAVYLGPFEKYEGFKEGTEQIRESLLGETVLVRFRKKTGEFAGRDLRPYGPFSQGDVVRMPIVDAFPLLSSNIVQLLPLQEDYSLADMIDFAKVTKIARYMEQFEKLLEVTKAEMQSKFYRDHLNHVIRTYFLSLKLADIFGVAREEFPSIVFASLFHDIALPLQEAYKMFATISDALGKTYDSIKVSAFGLEFKQPDRVSALLAILRDHAQKKFRAESATKAERILLRNLLQGNHGVLGALEAPIILSEDEGSNLPNTVKDALLAISFHDSELPSDVSLQEFPVLTLLMIADELQEWGRPVFSGRGYMVPMECLQIKATYEETKNVPKKIKEFSVILNYENHPKELEPILQVKSKFRRLKCIVLNEIRFKIIFMLPNYKTDIYVSPTKSSGKGNGVNNDKFMVIRQWPQLLENHDILWENVNGCFCDKIPAEIRTIEINHDPTRRKPKWFVTINGMIELSESEITGLLPRIEL